MNPLLLHVEAVTPQPWKNGGGQTRELYAWPTGPDWQVRISRADIAADGPFSAFAGVQRWFTVLEGAGVVLEFGAQERRLCVGDLPLAFDGGAAPGCRLIAGPTQDLNLMVRAGLGDMQAVTTGTGCLSSHAMRGLYVGTPGTWSDGHVTLPLVPHTLLWAESGDASPWTFTPDATGSTVHAWWIGFTPQTTDQPERDT